MKSRISISKTKAVFDVYELNLNGDVKDGRIFA